MIEWFWTEGRFGWPFVSAVVTLTVAVVLADLAWRFWKMPFERFLLRAALGFALAAAGFVAVWMAIGS